MDKPLEKQLALWLKLQKKQCGFYLNLTVLMGLLTGACLILQAYLISTILHGIIILNLPKANFTDQFIYLLALLPIRAMLAYARERSSFEAGKQLRLHIRNAVLNKLSELGPVFIKGKPAGSWATIVLEQVENLHDFYARYLPQMLLAAFIPIIILMVVFPLNWAAGLILLGTAPLIPLFMILVGMGAADANRKNFSALTKLSGHFMDRLKGLKTIKLFNRGNAEGIAIENASESFRSKTMSVLRIAFLSSAVLEFFGAISIALLAIYFGFSFLGHLNFGDYDNGFSLFVGMFVLMLAPEFYQPLRDMGTHYHAKAQAIGAAEELMKLLDYQVPNSANSNNIKADLTIDSQSGIQIVAKSFSVHSHSGTCLVGPIDFSLESSQHIAVVGPSGAGKSSLLNGLLGFLPYQGSLTINGMELKSLSLANWRKHLAWLGQEPQLFHGTIRDNVAMADPNMDDDHVMKLLSQAKILDFVNQQSLGLEHPIGEQMSGLSVGQAQRIALARALGQQASLFLLDEPTASLDRHSEQSVLTALDSAMANASCLIVTHRLDQLSKMDNILVLDKGTIVQQGNFDTLNQIDGLFKQMQRDERDPSSEVAK
ncbi:cysteine/glutathione ABC transporter permease/ATP-binding protein CydD [Psychromonas sp. psych-6C06]|uniref:heme ABC transporter permease/ATP-binding protein CydD n=1 Tax=Psychromonas sp. psych-6C06 TaxID=2058089 RepID=UPI000C32FAB9|nr:cysteine/glutathione ABC transporter permease/ATP-binding protein CydD [Psychromonas sp. psych-6C06]PKF62033.1 cysteine/glutathione ABC transporter permease/ATP-binding protein CydD [Psychromonas sp. psych-6C06]